MDFKIKIKNKEYQIELKENCGAVKIKIGGKEFVFGSNKGSLIEAQSSIKKDSLNKGIASSLSGVITKIFVKEGSHVKAGNKFLTLSAMKMENEIVAENDCKVKKILIKEGQQVKEGEVLIILE